MSIIKITNTEISISTANTVYNSKLIRLVNPTTSNVVVTLVASPTSNLDFTILGNSEILFEKSANQAVKGTGILATPIVYKN